jgi:leader peptidase (prepilin peptidase)/N-methyltransferase
MFSFYPDDDIPEESIVAPVKFNVPKRSICPSCKATLYWYHNIPLLSWFLLNGKCAFCKSSISYRYPFVELFSALLAYLSLFKFGFTVTALLIYLICAALLVVVFIDLDYFIIPDLISKNGTYLGISLSIVNVFFPFLSYPFNQNLFDLCFGLLAGGGFLYTVAKLYLWLRRRDGLGLGDVKLLFMVGAFFGYKGALTTIILGSMLGTIIGVLILILSRLKLSHYIAFGPYLVMGCYMYIFLGEEALLIVLDSLLINK